MFRPDGEVNKQISGYLLLNRRSAFLLYLWMFVFATYIRSTHSSPVFIAHFFRELQTNMLSLERCLGHKHVISLHKLWLQARRMSLLHEKLAN